MQEIERKFLLAKPLDQILRQYSGVIHILVEQRYLGNSGKWTTRIRRTVVRGKTEHWITLKKKITDVSCVELETLISADFYQQMATHCGPALHKTRHVLEHGGHQWELDHFLNPVFNNLVIAEIELSSEQDVFTKPEWLGKEVTEDKQYKNAQMVKRLMGE